MNRTHWNVIIHLCAKFLIKACLSYASNRLPYLNCRMQIYKSFWCWSKVILCYIVKANAFDSNGLQFDFLTILCLMVQVHLCYRERRNVSHTQSCDFQVSHIYLKYSLNVEYICRKLTDNIQDIFSEHVPFKSRHDLMRRSTQNIFGKTSSCVVKITT